MHLPSSHGSAMHPTQGDAWTHAPALQPLRLMSRNRHFDAVLSEMALGDIRGTIWVTIWRHILRRLSVQTNMTFQQSLNISAEHKNSTSNINDQQSKCNIYESIEK